MWITLERCEGLPPNVIGFVGRQKRIPRQRAGNVGEAQTADPLGRIVELTNSALAVEDYQQRISFGGWRITHRQNSHAWAEDPVAALPTR